MTKLIKTLGLLLTITGMICIIIPLSIWYHNQELTGIQILFYPGVIQYYIAGIITASIGAGLFNWE
jgi:hypothetical protein